MLAQRPKSFRLNSDFYVFPLALKLEKNAKDLILNRNFSFFHNAKKKQPNVNF